MSDDPQYVRCRCGETHEVYDGYRYCPTFHEQVNVVARREGVEPLHVLSAGKWTHPVSNAELGIVR